MSVCECVCEWGVGVAVSGVCAKNPLPVIKRKIVQ